MAALECDHCGSRARIEVTNKDWDFDVHRLVHFHGPGTVYQPLYELVSDRGSKVPDQIRILYYDDHRDGGGSRKRGHGPGGPAVLTIGTFIDLAEELKELVVQGEATRGDE